MHLSRVDDERMTPLGPGRVGSAALADALSADHSVQPAVRPLINELSAGADWAALRFSPTYYGWGVPHGNGEPVILVPGFFGSDLSLTELFWWLARIGYEPHYSGLGFNSDCPDASATALASTVIRTAAESGRRIHLIGHSLGALIARSVAFEHSDCVDLLISLAAPFNDVAYVHPVLIETMATIRGQPGTNLTWNVGPTCFSGHCTCLFTGNIMRPAKPAFRRVALHATRDGLVDPKSCLESEPDKNIGIETSHYGIVWNSHAYEAIARTLAVDAD